MDAEWLATAAAVVSFYAALFHGWVFALHPGSREHAWVAVAALGAAVVSVGTALAYASQAAPEALLAQRVQIVGAPLVTLGGLQFAASRLGLEAPRFLAGATVLTAAVVGMGIAAPQLLLETGAAPRETVVLGRPFLQHAITPLGQLALAALWVYFATPLVLAWRARARGQRGARPLLACFAFTTVGGLSDSAVGLGLVDLPYLMPGGGYALVCAGFSAVLLADIARAMSASERLSDRLQGLAEARADALRVIDLRLARGEQLAAIGTLAAGVAHEINNPLAYVSTNLNQLRALAGNEDDPDEVREILAECREGVARVGTIVSDLLRMAHHGSHAGEVCDLGAVVRSVLPLVVREAGASTEIVTDADSPLPVCGGARLLGQVVLNLALNAVHAVGEGAVDGPRVELVARRAPGGAELVVRDNGAGIPAEVADQIFDASFTTKSLGRGTGLGLALTRLVVTRLRGEIGVASGPTGTEISVWLPAAAPALERPAA